MRRSFPPFLTPPESCVMHGGWWISEQQEKIPLPNEMKHWDYQSILHLSSSVQIQRREVLQSCQLGEDSVLVVVVSAHSDHTRTEREVARLLIPREDRFDLAVQFELPGQALGGTLTLRTMLVAADPRPLSELAAAEPASILWSTSHRTHLQGLTAQFPTDAFDFSGADPVHARAAWRLRLDTSDTEARFLSAVRLTLNNAHESIRDLLNGVVSPSVQQIERSLKWDVTRQLVSAGLALSDVRALDFDADATTVAGVLRNVIAAVWPSSTADEVHKRMLSDPVSFELDIQHHCGLVN